MGKREVWMVLGGVDNGGMGGQSIGRERREKSVLNTYAVVVQRQLSP